MHDAHLVSVWIHIIAAAIWIGGSVFIALVLVPFVRSRAGPDGPGLIRDIAKRFQPLGWICLMILLVTGALNIMLQHGQVERFRHPDFWETTYGNVLVLKLALVAAILLLSLAHDLWLGPRVTRLREAEPDAPATRSAARRVSWLARLTLLMGLAAVGAGVVLGHS